MFPPSLSTALPWKKASKNLILGEGKSPQLIFPTTILLPPLTIKLTDRMVCIHFQVNYIFLPTHEDSLGPTSTKMQLNLVNNNLNTELGNGSNGGSIRNLSSSLSIQRKVRPNQPGKHHDLGTDAKVDSTQTMGLNAELLSLLPLHYYLRVSRNFSNQIF